MIRNAEDYTPGTPIRLLVCWSGACENGFAQQLADILGVEVLAANGPIASGSWLRNGYRVNRVTRLKVTPPDDLIVGRPPGFYSFFPRTGG